MIRTYYFILFFILSGLFFNVSSQEAQIFRIEDFDLKGNVKSCFVVTKYGKEEYDFDVQGRLIKSVTRFSDQDYDVTRYKIENGELTERRTENYRDGVFESSTSFASFYTTERGEPRIVLEKIFSYDKEFLDSYRYSYDNENNLIKIIHAGTDGENITVVEHSKNGDTTEQVYRLNDEILKSNKITTSNKEKTKTELLVTYVAGVKSSATEKVYNEANKIIKTSQMYFDSETDKFILQKQVSYNYVASGVLNKVITKSGENESLQQYIYQFDNGDTGNWVKEIITPDNLYTTRKVIYYPEEEEKQE